MTTNPGGLKTFYWYPFHLVCMSFQASWTTWAAVIILHIITWVASAYGTFSRPKKISRTSEWNERVSYIFWGSENVPYARANHVIKFLLHEIIIACNKPFIAWFARAYDPFSLSQKISLTRSFHSLVRDIFFARENVSYGLTTHAIIYMYVNTMNKK